MPPASPRASANRVEYRRRSLVEWYADGPGGLEQGFTIEVPPSGRGDVRIELALRGDGSGRVDSDGRNLTWSGADDRGWLRYGGLSAVAADGRELPATMALLGNRLTITVDDAGAVYPVTVDPFLEKAKLTASDGAENDDFGFSVALSGTTLVAGAFEANVGANEQQGAMYVFVEPSGGWATTSSFTATLTASEGKVGDSLGYAVAISGNTIVAGALNATIDSNFAQGAAYVFVKPPGGWATTSTFDAKLTAADGTEQDAFGYSVAISDDTVVAAAASTIGNNQQQGAAYVFVKPSTGWDTTSDFAAKLTASDGAEFDELGTSVAIDGNTIVAGSPDAMIGLHGQQGAVYVFVKPSTGWATTSGFTAKLTASDGATNDLFGTSAAIDGDTVVVGAVNATARTQGAAYVFVKPASGWATTAAFTARLTASDGQSGDSFGTSVALSGDVIAAGAPFATVGSRSQQGAAYVFVMPSAGWATTSGFDTKLTAPDGAPDDLFGTSVAASGDTVTAGAYAASIGSHSEQGAAYVYARPPTGPPPCVSTPGERPCTKVVEPSPVVAVGRTP